MKIRKSYISALIIAVLIIGWMYSDDVLGTSSSGETDQEKLATLEVEENVTAAPELITQAFRVVNQLSPIANPCKGRDAYRI